MGAVTMPWTLPSRQESTAASMKAAAWAPVAADGWPGLMLRPSPAGMISTWGMATPAASAPAARSICRPTTTSSAAWLTSGS